jgi:hypothetical protein
MAIEINQEGNALEVVIDDNGERLPGEEDPVMPEVGLEIEIDFGDKEEGLEAEEDGEFFENLAEVLSEEALTKISSDLIGDFDADSASRKDWIQTYIDGLELLGLKIEERTEPWDGACGVFHPLLSEALVKFQSETIMETFPAGGPVRTKIIGKETPEKKQAAENVEADMNYQLTEVMTEYRPEHERMLWGLGLSGNAFKKIYFDPSLDRQVAIYAPAEDVIVPYGASDLESSERITHVMRKTHNEVRRLQATGFYLDIDLPDPENGETYLDEVDKKIAENMGFSVSNDHRHRLLEMQVDLDLSEYDEKDPCVKSLGNDITIAVPYIVTIDYGSREVLSIRRNWNEDDNSYQKRAHFVHYSYIPGFGFYAFGLIHLLGAFSKSGTSIIRQLVDAGTLSNLPGGYKTKGLRVRGDDTPIGPGEFRDVDIASGSLRDNIMPLPFKEPSATLFQLMQSIIEEGRRFASIADLKISDMSAQSPVGTTLAVLERMLKVMSAVQARVHSSMKQEFKLLAKIIRDYTDDSYTYEPLEGDPRAKKSDYDYVEVIPVSDPNSATMAQRVVQYQAALQLAQTAPQLYDLPTLHKQMLNVLGIKNVNKILPTEEDIKPLDPVSENMNIFKNKPVKAFIHQDHEAHMQAHMSLIQDPMIQQTIGQSPAAQVIQAALQAHIGEHLAFLYRNKIEEQLGTQLPPPDEPLPAEIEVALSRVIAQAAEKLLQQDTAEVQQQQQQQEAQDPLNIIQRTELQLKTQELQHKMAMEQSEMQNKTQVDQAKIELEKAKLLIEAAKAQEDSDNKERELAVKQLLEGVKIGQNAISQSARDNVTAMNRMNQRSGV